MFLQEFDRRVIYLLVLVALSAPLLSQYSIKPARMKSAEKVHEVIESLPPGPGKLVLVVMDFGPNSMAENLPQSEVIVEHLMRKRVPFAVMSQYPLAEPFLQSVPSSVAERLTSETGERWDYGKDWVNLGYQPGGSLMIRNLAGSDNLIGFFRKDARGNELDELKAFDGIKTLADIPVLAQFTSLVGTLDSFLQFLKRKDYRPVFVHGCTSITIPQAFIYLDSGQLAGLLEGIAGAAWYSQLLKDHYPKRAKDSSLVINTGLGIAHLVIIALVIFGNAAYWSRRRK